MIKEEVIGILGSYNESIRNKTDVSTYYCMLSGAYQAMIKYLLLGGKIEVVIQLLREEIQNDQM